MKPQLNLTAAALVLAFLMTPAMFAADVQNMQMDRQMQTALSLWYGDSAGGNNPGLAIQSVNGTGAIEGTVMEGGSPIEGALVFAWSVTSNSVVTQSATTAADGSYSLQNLDAGDYYVVATADGYFPTFYGNGQNPFEADMVTVVDGETTTGIDMKLKKAKGGAGSISGVVSSEDGAPIPGAWVVAFGANNPFQMNKSFAVSNDDGAYVIGNLPKGMYLVAAYANGYLAELYDNTTNPLAATPVVVNDDQATGIDFALSKGGSISGHVQNDQGEAIAGAVVSATADAAETPGGIPGLQGMMQKAVTDANGDYSISGLAGGDYIVAAMLMNAGGGIVKFWQDKDNYQEADPVTVEQGAEVSGIDFTFVLPTAKIAGIVTDNDGAPLKNIYIYYVRENSDFYQNFGRLWKNTLTDENGAYEIANLPAGTYYVSAWHWDWMNFKGVWYENADSLKDATPIVLADGETRDDVNMTLDLTSDYGSISGVVTLDDNGDPVANAFVEAVPVKNHPKNPWHKRLPTAFAMTGADGVYTMSPVYKGDYRVIVRVNNYKEYFDDKTSWDEADIVAVEAGQDTPDINFGVPGMPTEGSLVNGVVTDEESGAPLDGALVAIFPTARHKWFNGDLNKWGKIYYTTFTNADGAYAIGGIPEGAYVASAWARDYVGEFYDNVRNPFKATALELDGENSVADVDFALRPRQGKKFAEGPGQGRYGSIGGLIQSNHDGAPIAGAFVYAIDANAHVIASEISAEDGSYSLDGLEEGGYTVMASRSLYETTYYPNAPDASSASTIEVSADGALDISDATVTMSSGEITGVQGNAPQATPTEFDLLQNYPNPFNPTTVIEYHVPESANVTLQIFNVQGQLIRTLVDANQAAQSYKVVWDGRDMTGSLAPSGVYFYQIQANNFTATRALLFMK